MRVVCIDDTWPLDRANAIIGPAGAEVVFDREIAGDDVVGVLTYPGGRIDASVLERAPNVRVVATCSTGHDHLEHANLIRKRLRTLARRGALDPGREQEILGATIPGLEAVLHGAVG